MFHRHQEIVQELRDLLLKNKEWAVLLVGSIKDANKEAKKGLNKDQFKRYCNPKIESFEDYFNYLDWFVTWSPAELEVKDYSNQHPNHEPSTQFNKEVLFQLCRFYWFLDQKDGLTLQKYPEFRKWMVDFANDWGSYLNTTDSIDEKTLQSFINDPAFNMDQFMMPPSAYTPVGKEVKSNGPSGWLTFNQFFAREVNPGLRPVSDPYDDEVITCPADSKFKATFPINQDSEVVIKETHKYKVSDLLHGSPYQDDFINGTFYHRFLGPNDYHRFHAPVSGTVLESRAVQANVYLEVTITDGEFDAPDSADGGYEFSQTRGILILDSSIGKVAVIPVGMAQVSSVNMPAVVGTHLNKGDEFGYFLFGGSDIILLFQENANLQLNTQPIHFYTGKRIGTVAT